MDQFIDYLIEGQEDGIRLALRDGFHVIDKTDWLHGVNRSDMSQQFIKFEPVFVCEDMAVVKCFRKDGEGNVTWVVHVTVINSAPGSDKLWNDIKRLVEDCIARNFKKDFVIQDLELAYFPLKTLVIDDGRIVMATTKQLMDPNNNGAWVGVGTGENSYRFEVLTPNSKKISIVRVHSHDVRTNKLKSHLLIQFLVPGHEKSWDLFADILQDIRTQTDQDSIHNYLTNNFADILV